MTLTERRAIENSSTDSSPTCTVGCLHRCPIRVAHLETGGTMTLQSVDAIHL